MWFTVTIRGVIIRVTLMIVFTDIMITVVVVTVIIVLIVVGICRFCLVDVVRVLMNILLRCWRFGKSSSGDNV